MSDRTFIDIDGQRTRLSDDLGPEQIIRPPVLTVDELATAIRLADKTVWDVRTPNQWAAAIIDALAVLRAAAPTEEERQHDPE